MFYNYLKIIMRNLIKNKSFSFINLIGLSIGLASSILILLWVQDELSYDSFNRNADQIHRVVTEMNYGGSTKKFATTPGPLAEALKNEIPEIQSFSRIHNGGRRLVKYKDKKILIDRVLFTDESFLSMFSFQELNDHENIIMDKSSVILTEENAKKFFGEENPVGKTINIDEVGDLKVAGVLKNLPSNSHLQFDIIASFNLLEGLGEPVKGWGRFRYYCYVMFNENTSFADVGPKVTDYFENSEIPMPAKLHLQPLKSIYFNSDFGADFVIHGNKTNVYTIFAIAIFVLLIACINFMNLATAHAGKRSKEIGIRKVSGANRKSIIKQFLAESMVFSFLSLFLSLIIIELILPAYNQFTGKALLLDYFNNPILTWGLITITIFTGLFAGSYPALYLSSFSPSKVLTGIYKNGSQNTLFRKILVVTQFSISIILIICTFTIFNQINFIKNKSLGYERDQVLFLPLRGGVEKNLEMMKSELLQNSNIISVSAGNALPNRIAAMTSGISWDGKDPDDNSMFRFVSVDHEYLKTFQMEILKGRHFSKEFASDTEEAFIINEEAAKVLGINSPEEKTVTFMERESKIIGIVKNFHFRSMYEEIEPLFIGILPEKYSYFYLFIKTNTTDYAGLINQLESFWEKHCPQFPFEYHFVNESFENMYQPINRINKIFSFFSALAVFISCMGLFGLSAFMVEQRTKEIGIRKTMGASVSGIVLLLSKEFVKWIIWANILAWPIAYFAMNKWLQNFAYKIEIGIWIFIISALLAMMIAVLTISFQSIKAAIANPVESLRYE